jgi:hypothetical protein
MCWSFEILFQHSLYKSPCLDLNYFLYFFMIFFIVNGTKNVYLSVPDRSPSFHYLLFLTRYMKMTLSYKIQLKMAMPRTDHISYLNLSQRPVIWGIVFTYNSMDTFSHVRLSLLWHFCPDAQMFQLWKCKFLFYYQNNTTKFNAGSK